MIRNYFDSRIEKAMQDPARADDKINDNNKIISKLWVSSLYNVIKLTLHIWMVTYLVAMIWCIILKYQAKYIDPENDYIFFNQDTSQQMSKTHVNGETYVPYFTQLLMLIYFAFTTLSSIGFGDFYPQNIVEKLIGVFMLFLGGVAVFSYIMGVYIEIIHKFSRIDQDFEESDQLEKFFCLISHFNKNKMIPSELKKEITTFMERKWDQDRNNCI